MGIELTTSRLRQLRQLPVVQHVRFTPLKLRQKNATPMACPRLHWTTDNPSGMHRCQFPMECSISVLAMLLILLSHLIYRIRYGWQWHIRYIHSFQQYMTRSFIWYANAVNHNVFTIYTSILPVCLLQCYFGATAKKNRNASQDHRVWLTVCVRTRHIERDLIQLCCDIISTNRSTDMSRSNWIMSRCN